MGSRFGEVCAFLGAGMEFELVSESASPWFQQLCSLII